MVTARVFEFPKPVWEKLYKLYIIGIKAGCPIGADAHNLDTTQRSVLDDRKQKVIEEAMFAKSNVWDFEVNHPMMHPHKNARNLRGHLFFIARDEEELENRVSVIETMLM